MIRLLSLLGSFINPLNPVNPIIPSEPRQRCQTHSQKPQPKATAQSDSQKSQQGFTTKIRNPHLPRKTRFTFQDKLSALVLIKE